MFLFLGLAIGFFLLPMIQGMFLSGAAANGE